MRTIRDIPGTRQEIAAARRLFEPGGEIRQSVRARRKRHLRRRLSTRGAFTGKTGGKPKPHGQNGVATPDSRSLHDFSPKYFFAARNFFVPSAAKGVRIVITHEGGFPITWFIIGEGPLQKLPVVAID